ncbi:MAG: zinc ribbon domain-containing protein [Chthoniobacterales bacterium]
MRIILTAACAVLLGLTGISDLFAQEPTGATVHCPTCGQVMPASFHFCSNCGTNLENVPRDSAPTVTTTTSVTRNEHGAVTHSTTTTTTKKSFQFSDIFRNPLGGHGSALSDQPAPLALKGFPERPKPIVEIGLSPFLGSGPIAPGFVIPTGAVWQPDFIVFGTARSALQTFDSGNGKGQITEWANRLDLYGNLYFTPTERILIGFRPLDRDGLDYSGYRFDPPPQRLKNDLNAYITTLFLQGDFGELFPRLDPNDTKNLDYQFAVGRQPLSFEDGIMINEDVIDAVGITRTSLFGLGASALRTTALFAWNELNRNDNLRDNSARLFGLFSSADYDKATIDLDLAFVSADDYTGGDGAYIGVGDTQRIGLLNSTTRINASFALDRETPAVSTGVLLFQQFSMTLPDSEDIVYLDGFWGIADYSSAARGGDRGGPLGQTGILFAAQGLGSYGAPLGNRANDAVGLALGYQRFLGSKDRQIVFEVGGRVATRDPRFFSEDQPNEIAAAVRYQMKLNQHMVLVLDVFVGAPEDNDTAYGLRSELLLKF